MDHPLPSPTGPRRSGCQDLAVARTCRCRSRDDPAVINRRIDTGSRQANGKTSAHTALPSACPHAVNGPQPARHLLGIAFGAEADVQKQPHGASRSSSSREPDAVLTGRSQGSSWHFSVKGLATSEARLLHESGSPGYMSHILSVACPRPVYKSPQAGKPPSTETRNCVQNAPKVSLRWEKRLQMSLLDTPGTCFPPCRSEKQPKNRSWKKLDSQHAACQSSRASSKSSRAQVCRCRGKVGRCVSRAGRFEANCN